MCIIICSMSNTDIEQEICETRVYFGSEARKKLYDGIKIAAEAVGATMGPRGRTVLIQKKGKAPVLTKDGVTVSRSIKLPDPVEKMGAELILEAANRTNEVAGDGTRRRLLLGSRSNGWASLGHQQFDRPVALNFSPTWVRASG